MPTRCACLLLALLASIAAAQDKYSGPRPPKADVPYLMHADNLLETDQGEAREESRKEETAYIVPGAAAKARTPLAEPIFLLLSDKLDPASLELYQMEIKDGNRQVIASKKKKDSARPLRLMVSKLAEKLYRIEVSESMGLERGEYSITPQGSNQVFCFQVY